jgi:predicted Zn-dependent protease
MKPATLFGPLAAAVALLIVPVAAGQNRQPENPFPPGGFKFPAGFPQDFAPDKFFEQFFGGGADLENDAALAEVEVTQDEEAKLGQQGVDDLKKRLAQKKIKLLDKGQEVQYLARLVELIRPQMQQAKRYPKLRVYLAELDDPDAYTLPGGHIFFSRGLLDAAGCEAALVCVAGHELAHLDRGHLLRRTKQWKLAQERMAKSSSGDFSFEKMMQMNSAMMQLFRRPFGPEEELEADRDGITWAYRAGYDPRALGAIYQAFDAAGKNPPEFMPAFFRTHPLTAERRENLTQTHADLQAAEPKAGLYLGRENLARRLTRAQREFAE